MRLDDTTWRDLDLGVTLQADGLDAVTLAREAPAWAPAFASMADLEAGSIANPDEGRQVGHYWLRAPELAPGDLAGTIRAAREACRSVAAEAHESGDFDTCLVLGIGGSALGPQLVADALAEPDDRLRVVFLDNSDPDGFARVLGPLDLARTLVVVISKSGGTAETRNALVVTREAYARAGVDFPGRAIAVSGEGSTLWRSAAGWRARLPMWDWVGGRTSLGSAVGILPMDLQGVDADAFLAGAAAMDARTRIPDLSANPAARLALAWHLAAEGTGKRAMVVLPYRDRLVLMSRYLQQLVMESLGKEHDLAGRVVHQGLAVYGNKGSTDQHAYVQQLRDGVANFFVTFLEVRKGRKGRSGDSIEVEPGNSSADYLQGFLRGTRKALYDSGRKSITISIPEVTPFQLGALIGLFERAVSFYASLVNINAYHQPGVEAGKKAASNFLELLGAVRSRLVSEAKTAEQIAASVDADPEDVYHCLTHLSANGEAQISLGATPAEDNFSL